MFSLLFFFVSRSSNPISPGLSVSHDSVFPHSGSELELDTAKSTSSLSIHQPILPDPRLQVSLMYLL